MHNMGGQLASLAHVHAAHAALPHGCTQRLQHRLAWPAQLASALLHASRRSGGHMTMAQQHTPLPAIQPLGIATTAATHGCAGVVNSDAADALLVVPSSSYAVATTV